MGHFGYGRHARHVRNALRLGHKLIIHAITVVGLKKFKKALIKIKKRPKKVKKQLEKVKYSLTVKNQDMQKVIPSKYKSIKSVSAYNLI